MQDKSLVITNTYFTHKDICKITRLMHDREMRSPKHYFQVNRHKWKYIFNSKYLTVRVKTRPKNSKIKIAYKISAIMNRKSNKTTRINMNKIYTKILKEVAQRSELQM